MHSALGWPLSHDRVAQRSADEHGETLKQAMMPRKRQLVGLVFVW